jgi:hypothetical protein
MKFPLSQKWAAVCVSILAMTAVLRSSADQAATTLQPKETYTGTVTVVDPQGRVLDVKGGTLSNKKFNLGDTCAYTIVGKDTGSIGDLHPGQQVTVSYHIASLLPADRIQQEQIAGDAREGRRIMINNRCYTNDVFVADCVQQELMTCNGTVRTNDLANHTLMLRFLVLNKTFQIAPDCQMVLSDGKSGAITDIQSGNYVTVTYETPGDEAVAYKIAQTDSTFNGRVIALNQANRTITTAPVLNFHSREFHLADNCAIVVNGKTNAPLSDIKMFDRLVFTYNNIKGVNVVSLITTNVPTFTTNAPTSLSTTLSTRTKSSQTRVIKSPRMQGTQ